VEHFPLMLYRPGSALRVWNAHDVDTLTVHDEISEREALRAGWTRRPDQKPEKSDDRHPAPASHLPAADSSSNAHAGLRPVPVGVARHPLDHDGDGRKGGSLPRRRKEP
jgi:hypothetical protein